MEDHESLSGREAAVLNKPSSMRHGRANYKEQAFPTCNDLIIRASRSAAVPETGDAVERAWGEEGSGGQGPGSGPRRPGDTTTGNAACKCRRRPFSLAGPAGTLRHALTGTEYSVASTHLHRHSVVAPSHMRAAHPMAVLKFALLQLPAPIELGWSIGKGSSHRETKSEQTCRAWRCLSPELPSTRLHLQGKTNTVLVLNSYVRGKH